MLGQYPVLSLNELQLAETLSLDERLRSFKIRGPVSSEFPGKLKLSVTTALSKSRAASLVSAALSPSGAGFPCPWGPPRTDVELVF